MLFERVRWNFPFGVSLSALLLCCFPLSWPSSLKCCHPQHGSRTASQMGGFCCQMKTTLRTHLEYNFFFCQYPVIVLNECTRKYALFHQRSLSFVNLTQLFFLSVFNMFRHFGSRPETRQTSRKTDLHACVRVKFLLAAQTLRFLSAAVESVNEKNVNKCA